MHPVLSTPGRLGLACLLWAPLVAGLVVLYQTVSRNSWPVSLILTVPPLVLELFFVLAVWYVCQSVRPDRRTIARFLAVHLLSAALMTSLWIASTGAYGQALDHWIRPAGWFLNCQVLAPFQVALGLIFYSLACLCYYLLMLAERTRQAEQAVLEREIQLVRAELRTLRAAIHPHFLFNSLNALAALTRSDAERAREICLQLADFLRYSLRHGQSDLVNLDEELNHARAYLDIEKTRLGERLRVEWEIPPDVRTCKVPALILLPLLENAVKHGIGPSLDGGTIRLEVSRQQEWLRIIVANSIDMEARPAPGTGFGLLSLRQRLIHACGPSARLDSGREGDGWAARVLFPPGAVEAASEVKHE